MKLVIGLGNPGRRYARTRHNIGTNALARLAERLGVRMNKKLEYSRYGIKEVYGGLVLSKPMVFMNQSGLAVDELVNKFSVLNSDLIVLHDDIDLPFARLRIKVAGGTAGHRGLDSIVSFLGTDNFVRIRLGIGHPGTSMDVTNYVLSCWTEHENFQMEEFLNKATDASIEVLSLGPEYAMNMFNRREHN